MIEELVINQLPAPTWNRLKMNETKLAGLELPQDSCEPRVALEGSVCLNKSKGSNCCAAAKRHSAQYMALICQNSRRRR